MTIDETKKLANIKILFKILGEITKRERKKLNKSQLLFSNEYGLEQSMQSRIENGVNNAKILSLLTIIEALGLKYSEFFKILEESLPPDFSLIDE